MINYFHVIFQIFKTTLGEKIPKVNITDTYLMIGLKFKTIILIFMLNV